MRTILLILLILCAEFFFAQNDTHVSSTEISAGLFYPNKSQFKNSIESMFNETFESPKQFFSLKIEHPRNYSKHNQGGEVGINYYLNQTRNFGDTMKLNWFANSMYAILKFDLLRNNKYVDVLLCGGGQIGAQRIIVEHGSQSVYKNLNVAIMPQVEIKVQPIKRFCFGIQSFYLYDISKGNWKKKQGEDFIFDYSKFTGLAVNAYLAWCWDGF